MRGKGGKIRSIIKGRCGKQTFQMKIIVSEIRKKNSVANTNK